MLEPWKDKEKMWTISLDFKTLLKKNKSTTSLVHHVVVPVPSSYVVNYSSHLYNSLEQTCVVHWHHRNCKIGVKMVDNVRIYHDDQVCPICWQENRRCLLLRLPPLEVIATTTIMIWSSIVCHCLVFWRSLIR